LILQRRVEVDGITVDQLGTKVDPSTQKILVDGVRLPTPKLEYFMLNKPPGILSTGSDPAGRLRVIDLIKTDLRVYNVGRLDMASEGLILVTNDGDLANHLTHPRFQVNKTYHVFVEGFPDRNQLRPLERGIHLAEGWARVASLSIRRRAKNGTWLEIVLNEGRNRQIRRLLARLGHKVLRLRRVAIGPLQLGDLPLGAHRRLTPAEVTQLKKA
jgi:23S rRNA pseudouridine2605 synthase